MIKRTDIILGDRRGFRRSSDILKRRLTKIVLAVLVLSYLFWAAADFDEEIRRRQALVDISRIEKATRLFRADLGRCPDDIEELFTPPSKRRYLERCIDPWGADYRLTCPAPRDPGGVIIVSGGPDGNATKKDDISSL